MAERLNDNMADVLFIAGYGRSGSTILEMLLGSHPAIFAAGELRNLFNETLVNAAGCECGLSVYRECPFWNAVFEHSGITPSADVLHDAHRITGMVEGLPDGLWASQPALRRYHDLWQRVFAAIREVSNRRWIVDSSKTAWRHSLRMPQLARTPDIHVKSVLLRRRLGAVIGSRRAGDNRAMEDGDYRTSHSAARTTFGWLAANGLARISMRATSRRCSVRYEVLISDPERALEPVFQMLGIDIRELPTAVLLGHTPIPRGHGIAGNRVRRQEVVYFNRRLAAR